MMMMMMMMMMMNDDDDDDDDDSRDGAGIGHRSVRCCLVRAPSVTGCVRHLIMAIATSFTTCAVCIVQCDTS
jgi:hypothetical protein